MTPRERSYATAMLWFPDKEPDNMQVIALAAHIELAITEHTKACTDIHAIEDTVSRSELDNEHEAHRRTAQSAAALRREHDAARRAQDAIAKRAVEAIDEWHAKFDAAETRLADLERFLRGDVRAYVAGSRRIPGMTLLDRIDAALSAPAQPATAAKACATCGYQGHCIYHDAAPPSPAATVNDGYFTCPTCKGIGSHGDECQWLQEHYPAATLGDELRKHERYLNREINYDERHTPAAREATMTCRAIEVTGQHCKVPIERDELWCGYHRGIAPEPMPDDIESVISSNRPPVSKDGDECPFCERTDPHNHGYDGEAIERVIEAAISLRAVGNSERGEARTVAIHEKIVQISAALDALDAARSKEKK